MVTVVMAMLLRLLLLLYHRDALFNEASLRARVRLIQFTASARRRRAASLPDWVQRHPPRSRPNNAASFQTLSIVSTFVLLALDDRLGQLLQSSRHVRRVVTTTTKSSSRRSCSPVLSGDRNYDSAVPRLLATVSCKKAFVAQSNRNRITVKSPL